MEDLREKYELKFLKMDQRVDACSLCCFNNELCGRIHPEDVDLLRRQVGQCTAKLSYYIKK